MSVSPISAVYGRIVFSRADEYLARNRTVRDRRAPSEPYIGPPECLVHFHTKFYILHLVYCIISSHKNPI